MEKLYLFILSPLIIISLILIGCSTPETSSSPITSPVITFAGTGDLAPESFLLSGEEGKFNFEVKWEAKGKLFNFFISPYPDESSIVGNYNDALAGTLLTRFVSLNPFATEVGFVIEVIATRDCNWVIEIWQ